MKRIIVAFIFSTLSIKGFSQIKYGISAGINIPQVTEDAGNNLTNTSDARVRPDVGFFFQIPLSHRFTIQPEIRYSMLGYKNHSSDTTVGVNLNYIALPVLVKYRFKRFSIFAGPQFDFLVKEKAFVNDLSAKSDFYKKNNISASLGLDYTFPFGLSLSLSSQVGVMNILKPDDQYNDLKHTMNNSRIMVGYILGQAKRK